MSNDQQKPSRVSHLPGILMGSAALIAAASTLYVNLRGDRAAPEARPAVVAPVEASAQVLAAAAPATATPAGPRTLRLRLDRVQVDNDGSVGSTDWSFQVYADEQPLFTVPMPALSDKPGENLVRPADADQASAEVELPRDHNPKIMVKGWKKRLLPGTPAEVSGSAFLALGLNKTVVSLKTDQAKGPAFVMYFSATEAN